MARPVTVTKERILSAAVDIVRRGGPQALSARSLTAALGCGASPIFASYGSMEGVLKAVKAEARALYERRVGSGFSLNPPFKGFGMAFLWFAMDEPELYRLIIKGDTPSTSFEEFIDTRVGFKQECLEAIGKSFFLQGREALMLYYQMVIVAMGLAQTCMEGGVSLHLSQAADILGKNVRAFLMVIHAGADERERYIPGEGKGPEGDIGSYSGMTLEDTLMWQNHLLEQLHKQPRYIRDGEWDEMERVLRNTSGITRDSLRKELPSLTDGDVRITILERLQFSVTEQAVLLGISPASVTKARQRLKNKFK